MTTSTEHLSATRAFGLPILRRTMVAGRAATASPPASRQAARPFQVRAAGRLPTTPDGGRPRGGGRRRLAPIIRELVLVGTAALLYSLVRGLTDDRVGLAFANAERLMSFEQWLGIFVEPRLQSWAVASDIVVNVANAIYILYWPIIVGTLVWLVARRPEAYRFYRNALLASGGFSLAVFALYPLAPPRFMPDHGFVDTIAAHSEGYREFNASALVNEYAAMPSLHFGWVLLAGIAIYRLVDHRLARAVGVALPVLMLSAIVLTGNHYLMDAVVGGGVVVSGLGIAGLFARRVAGQPIPH
ncbi:MAG TPA: phosphatase PAP2 family protein [Jiangellaceae bacterium]